jgi:FAD/FMN-containing dehydrogenase
MNDIELQLADLLGAGAVVSDEGLRERYLLDWTRSTRGEAAAIVRPSSVADVARTVAWCSARGLGVVPQGGHTGLAGGATPIESSREVVLSLELLNRVREVDAVSNTITVEAGAVLHNVQEVAAQANRLFPLSLGAEGSAQIGGCIATNAGGTAVLRYGNARELVLGLEVVLPDGTVWSRLRALRKDNAGFDLKHLFIGTEGTLGIVTAATLKIFPQPRQKLVALIGTPSPQAAVELFVDVRDEFDASLTGFELMAGEALSLACTHLRRARPLPGLDPYVVLLELSSPRAGGTLTEPLLECLGNATERGVVTDAVIASSDHQAQSLWEIRETVPEAMLRHFPQVSAHDVSVPIARMAGFIEQLETMVAERWPQLSPLLFGHVGDGNLHLNFVSPQPIDAEVFGELERAATSASYALVGELGGSISAEHGIGTHKMNLFHRLEDKAHLDLMGTIKRTLDSRRTMNPGKVFPRGG